MVTNLDTTIDPTGFATEAESIAAHEQDHEAVHDVVNKVSAIADLTHSGNTNAVVQSDGTTFRFRSTTNLRADLGLTDAWEGVFHGSTAGTARPSGAAHVLWVGTIEPTNMTDADVWADTDSSGVVTGGITLPYPYTVDASAVTGSSTITANRCQYALVLGEAVNTDTITMAVAASGGAGNMSVAVYEGSGTGTARVPTNRKATSGSVAVPATGVATLTLGSAIDIEPGDFMAVSCDTATATFVRQSHGSDHAMGGRSYYQASAHPCPSTAGTLVKSFATYWMVGEP